MVLFIMDGRVEVGYNQELILFANGFISAKEMG
jgi:hypothetical protein